ncbi:MAG: phytoene desaturase family protein, partial [Prevotella sp.]
NTFADTRLRAVLAGTSLKTGLHKETLPLFSFVHGNAGYVESSWRLRGGSTLIADTLAGRIRQRGGEIVCGADVRRLTMAGGRITAAECADGRTVTGRAFICDIHPAVVCSLVPEMRKSYARRITAMRNGTGMVTVSLRLKPRTLPYFNYNQYVYSHPDVWGADGTGDSVCGVLVSCRVPDGGGYYATQLDLLTPSDWNSWSRWAQTMTGRRGDDYKAAKNRIADECVRLAENFIPGLSGMVAGRYVSTPLTWRDYTATPEGCAYGLRKDFNMLMGGCLSLQTPVPNLFLTGQSPVLHGLHGVTMTALATCRLVAALG